MTGAAIGVVAAVVLAIGLMVACVVITHNDIDGPF